LKGRAKKPVSLDGPPVLSEEVPMGEDAIELKNVNSIHFNTDELQSSRLYESDEKTS